MLSELYDYAQAHDLAMRSGFKPKHVEVYLVFSRKGDFIGINQYEKRTVLCPDIGSAANGTKRCNVLVEKAAIVLCIVQDADKDKNVPVKHAFFLDALESGAQAEPLFAIAREALMNPETLQKARDGLQKNGMKPSVPIGLQVDGQCLEASVRYLPWWEQFRQQFAPIGTALLPRCLITGGLAPALATVPKVSGLSSVGGHTSGDAFLCFDKAAFQSYGFKKSANASVSEPAMTAVNAALTQLISKAKVLGGAKMLHWYKGPIPEEADLFSPLFGVGLEPVEGEEKDAPSDSEAEPDALRNARRLLDSLEDGQMPEAPQARYYLLPLSGVQGRVMVRGWEEGSYHELYDSIKAWFDDLRIVSPGGKGMTRTPKLQAIFVRLLKPGGDPKKVWERINKELSGLTIRVIHSILHNLPLPDEVASRALYWLRSDMLASAGDEASDSRKPAFESLAYQILKVWLLRRQRKDKGAVYMQERENPKYPGVAYHCGRLMAVYAAIQSEAQGPDLGAGVLERYYAAASTAPSLVLGKLATLSQYHLSKLRGNAQKEKYALRYEKMLGEIAEQIGSTPVPATLTLEQQTEFALGYYQKRAEIFTPRAARAQPEPTA